MSSSQPSKYLFCPFDVNKVEMKKLDSKEKLYTPPPPPFWPEGIFLRRRGGGGVYFESPPRQDFYTTPPVIRPPPLGGYFQGWGVEVYKIRPCIDCLKRGPKRGPGEEQARPGEDGGVQGYERAREETRVWSV